MEVIEGSQMTCVPWVKGELYGGQVGNILKLIRFKICGNSFSCLLSSHQTSLAHHIILLALVEWWPWWQVLYQVWGVTLGYCPQCPLLSVSVVSDHGTFVCWVVLKGWKNWNKGSLYPLTRPHWNGYGESSTCYYDSCRWCCRACYTWWPWQAVVWSCLSWAPAPHPPGHCHSQTWNHRSSHSPGHPPATQNKYREVILALYVILIRNVCAIQKNIFAIKIKWTFQFIWLLSIYFLCLHLMSTAVQCSPATHIKHSDAWITGCHIYLHKSLLQINIQHSLSIQKADQILLVSHSSEK